VILVNISPVFDSFWAEPQESVKYDTGKVSGAARWDKPDPGKGDKTAVLAPKTAVLSPRPGTRQGAFDLGPY